MAIAAAMSWAAAWGCSCDRPPSAPDAFNDSGLVFVGRVTGLRVSAGNKRSSDASVQTATVRVVEAFKGVAAGDEVAIRHELSPCNGAIPSGDDGRTDGGAPVLWLFYLHPAAQPGTWDIPPCHRSRLARDASAADDFLFLRGLPESRKRTRISGTIVRTGREPATGVGVRVIAKDGLTVETTTDANGVYETFGWAPGVYRVEIAGGVGKARVRWRQPFGRPKDLRKTWKLKSYEIELDENVGAGVDFELQVSSSVTGRVLDPEGRPIRDVCVALDVPGETASGCSDETGTYELEWAPAGTYYLVANPEGRVSAGRPFPRVYFPDKLTREEAKQVTLSDGDRLTGMDIHVPQMARLLRIAGRVEFSDGTPVRGAQVEFKSDVRADDNGTDMAAAYSETSETNPNGEFVLEVPAGRTGEIRSHLLLSVAAAWSERCSEWKVLAARAAGTESLEVVASPKVRWDGGAGAAAVLRIVFPFPACPQK